jgi:hypothetical protein
MDVCITFDDGRSDNFVYAVPLLKKYRLTATFFITTGFIDRSFVTDDFGAGREPMEIDQLQNLKKEGFELAAHGDRHIMEAEDYSLCLSKMRSWGLCEDKIGFSVPHTHYQEEELEKFYSDHADSLSYIRLGRNPRCFSFVNKSRYVLYHRLSRQKGLYYHFNEPNVTAPKDRIHLYSAMIKNDVRPSDVFYLLEKNKTGSAPLIFMFHSIIPTVKDMWEWSCRNFEAFCSFLSSDSHYHVITMQELSKNYF